MKKTAPNIANRTIFVRDNLDVLSGINDSCIDLIYLDPPFNSNRKFAAPAGSKAAGASFVDAWTLDMINAAWVDVIQAERPKLAALIKGIGEVNGNSDKAYLIFMARRLLEMHRVLKDTGSIYLHCDQTMSHSLKLLMDFIFGKKNFKNHLAWCYKENETATKFFPRKHDHILFYTKTNDYVFNVLRGEITEAQAKRYNHIDEKGNRWANMKGKKRMLEGGARLRDWWDLPITQKKERTGYPTQKPIALLERIIAASSNKGDLVLDPFCGCATAGVAAERLERQWIGVDLSDKSVDLIRERLEAEEHLWRQVGKGKHLISRKDLPERTDTGKIITNLRRHKKTLYDECGGYCQGCSEHFRIQHLEIDHKTPRSKGGTDTKGNLHLLCGSCNRIKGNRTQEYLIARLKELDRL